MRSRGLILLLVLTALSFWYADSATAQSAVGDIAPAAADTLVKNGDSRITATGAYRFMGSGGGIHLLDVAANGDATFYLYDINGSNVITSRYGPFYTRNWAPVRFPIPLGSRADMIHVTELSAAEMIVTVGGQ
ncbi:MAG: hypothetical protein ABFD96_13895 [Armatimonadia bacterium]